MSPGGYDYDDDSYEARLEREALCVKHGMGNCYQPDASVLQHWERLDAQPRRSTVTLTGPLTELRKPKPDPHCRVSQRPRTYRLTRFTRETAKILGQRGGQSRSEAKSRAAQAREQRKRDHKR